MLMRFVIFLSVVSTLLLLANFYIGTAWMNAYSWARENSRAVWMVLFFLIIVQVAGPLIYRMFQWRGEVASFTYNLGYLVMGITSIMLFYLFIFDVLKLLFRQVLTITPTMSFNAVLILVGTTLVVGLIQVNLGPQIKEVDVPIKDLPKELENFKIAQISDLHVGPTIGASAIKNVIEKTNRLNPNLIALTGDLLDGTVDVLGPDISLLKNLKATHGVFYVTGNHEHYWDAEGWLKAFRALGFHCLSNQHEIVDYNGAKLLLVGVNDFNPSLDLALKLAPRESKIPAILLVHQPKMYAEAHKNNMQLMLSGHTHGGQYFPWSLVVRLVHKFTKGLYDFEGLKVYVNSGTGYWGPPLRFLVPEEITLLKLIKEI